MSKLDPDCAVEVIAGRRKSKLEAKRRQTLFTRWGFNSDQRVENSSGSKTLHCTAITPFSSAPHQEQGAGRNYRGFSTLNIVLWCSNGFIGWATLNVTDTMHRSDHAEGSRSKDHHHLVTPSDEVSP